MFCSQTPTLLILEHNLNFGAKHQHNETMIRRAAVQIGLCQQSRQKVMAMSNFEFSRQKLRFYDIMILISKTKSN